MKHLIKIIFSLLLVSFFLSSCSKAVQARTEFVLGTVCTLNFFENGTEALYDEAFARLHTLESILSANSEVSNIAAINNNAGIAPVYALPETMVVLKEALIFSEKSSGSFDPTVGPLVKTWNIGTELAAIPAVEDLNKALELIDYTSVQINYIENTVFLPKKGMKLDLGGIAKGFAADEIVRILTAHKVKRAIIDLGGNVYAFGEKAENKSWTIGIRYPDAARSDSLLTIPIKNESVVTSGIYERFFEKDGIQYHHILDTKTGFPIQNGLVSVTIVSTSSIQADALSTSVFSLGYEKGSKLIESIPDTDAIFIFSDKKIKITGTLRDRVNLLSDEYTVIQ